VKKFKDPLNTAIFTTKFIVEDKKVIAYVTHDIEDGAWQFLSNDYYDKYEDIAMVLSLAEIIEIDQTVLEIADLQLGFFATRQSVKDSWTIYKMNSDNA